MDCLSSDEEIFLERRSHQVLDKAAMGKQHFKIKS
jgi:hypothetical protein